MLGEKGRPGDTYYIGSLSPRPLKDFLIEMRNCVDPSIEIGLGEIKSSGISLSFNEFNRMALYDEMGFKSQVTFKEGIGKTIEWLKNNMKTNDGI